MGRLVLVLDAVSALVATGSPATVNAVAGHLGIDQSGASRLVRAATDAGYVQPEPNPTDGRRREVSLTETGQDALSQAHKWQDEIFAHMTDDWTEAEREAFCRLMEDLVVRSTQIYNKGT